MEAVDSKNTKNKKKTIHGIYNVYYVNYIPLIYVYFTFNLRSINEKHWTFDEINKIIIQSRCKNQYGMCKKKKIVNTTSIK